MKRRKALHIGERVRAARKRAAMTLEALAKTSGVSKAMLSQIEQNKANPTVVVLCNVARALNLEIGDLLGATSAKTHLHIIRADNERYHFISNDQYSIRTLSPLKMEKDVEFYEIVLHANATLESDPHFRNTEEIITIARGRVKIHAGKEEEILRKRDSAHYSADTPHQIENPNKADAVVYMVVKYRQEP